MPEYGRLKDLPPDIRPRERLLARGAGDLSDAELLAIILRTGLPGCNVLDLSTRLLTAFRGLAGIDRASPNELCLVPGVGESKATEIKAAIDLGKRLVILHPDQSFQIRSPLDIFNLVHVEMSGLEQEELRVLLLNTKNRVLTTLELYRGTINSTNVRISELFKLAIRDNASAIALVHNHPSGDPTPSSEDVALTREAIEAGNLLGISVLDHVIVGRGETAYVSLKDRGLGFSTNGNGSGWHS